MKVKDIKKEFEEFVNKECKLHIDKPEGHDNCSMIVSGDLVAIQVMISSLVENLVKHDILTFKELHTIIDVVEKFGAEHESK